jgi:adenylylsulfate reductase subunit B
MPPRIDPEKCTGCGICADICPLQVFKQAKPQETPDIVFGEECWHCNACVLDCPSEALSLRLPLNYMLLHVDAAAFRK